MAGSDDVLGPFGPQALREATLGPYLVNGPRTPEDPPLPEAWGIGRDQVRSLLDAYPETRDLLSMDEGRQLNDYLNTGDRFDPNIIAGLVAELADGMKARKLQVDKEKAPKPIQVPDSIPGSTGEPPQPVSAPEGIYAPIHSTQASAGVPDYWFTKKEA